jgi:hypothetical protein
MIIRLAVGRQAIGRLATLNFGSMTAAKGNSTAVVNSTPLMWRRLNVLVQVEDIFRIVTSLDQC